MLTIAKKIFGLFLIFSAAAFLPVGDGFAADKFDNLSDTLERSALSSDLAVSGVRLGVNGDITRFVLDINQNSAFHVMSVKNPYRVVVTMPSLRWQLLPGSGQMQRGLVKNFRYGSFDANSFRIVLDLNAPPKIESVRLLPPDPSANITSHRLVIDLRAVDMGKFKPQQIGAYQPQNAAVVSKDMPPKSTPPVAPKSSVKNVATRTVIIDPGHGGVDPGAIGVNKTYEKNITLAAGKLLAEELQKKGYKVYLTRDSDEFIKLRDRVKFARDRNADLFISLHADHHNDRSVRGASVYTLSEKGSDAEAERLAEQENKADIIAGFDLTEENEAVSNILIDLAQQETRAHSIFYGNLLVQELKKSSGNIIESPLRSAGFAVLKAPDVPSVLVEMGYLSNKTDEASLNRPDYRAKLANAIAAAIDRYFTKIQNSPVGMQ